MVVEIPKTPYTGKIKEITLGQGPKAVKVGGETAYPFYLFEGEMPNLPKIAMEVFDLPPDDWPSAALEPFADVVNDPVAWAKKNINAYGADMICLQLISTDPNGVNGPAEAAARTAQKVAEAIDVPLIVWGTANHDKDTEVLRLVSDYCQGKNVIIGPLEEGDYKKIGASAIGYHQTVAASSPIDINLAKQLNILLENLGVSGESLIMDPTVSGVGYGIEYSYSVIERIRMAALTQQDDKLQYPIVANLAKEVWKTKEAHAADNESNMGDAKKRGILLEAISANMVMLAGADVIVMRHPEAIKLIREMIAGLTAK